MKLYGYSCIPLYFLFFRNSGLFLIGNIGASMIAEFEMAKPNTTFNLDVKDFELIEGALHSVIAKRSNDLINASDAQNSAVIAPAEAEMSEMRDLLGRLHNQKNWFRPKNGP